MSDFADPNAAATAAGNTPPLLDPVVSGFGPGYDPVPLGDLPLSQMIDEIRGSGFADVTQQCRDVYAAAGGGAPGKKAIEDLKCQLPGVTLAGTFSRRKTENWSAASGLVQIDVDGVEKVQLRFIMAKLKTLPYIICAWISPSGAGIKAAALVAGITGPDPKVYRKAWKAVTAALAELGIVKVVALDGQLRRLVRRVVAPQSEALISAPGQQPIPELVAAIDRLRAHAQAAGAVVPDDHVATAAAADPLARSGRRRTARGRGRLTLPDHLETVEERIDLPVTACVDHDGTPLVPVGVERSVRLDWVQGRFVRHITIRTRYGRRDTREPVLTAPIPPAILATEPPESPMAKGAQYLRNHWEALTRFVNDGRLPLDNNAAERQQRPIAVGRKNWLFVASEDGGAWAATLFSVFQSCRLQRIEPIAYLTDVLPALIAGDVDPLGLTPAAYAQRQQAKRTA